MLRGVKTLVARSALATCLGFLALACSSSKPTDAGSTIPSGPTTFSLTSTVAASSEAFKCTYVQMPAADGFIVGGEHQYTPGSHHLLLYRTDLTAIPAGAASPSVGDCYANDQDYMSHIRGVVYPAATPTGSMKMPSGVGLPYKANEIFLFQVHYLNPKAETLNTEVHVHLDTQTTPVQQNAGVLFFYDPFIYVPQGAQGKAGQRCPIPKDITMFSEGSHYHARGVNYQAYLDTPAPAAPTTSPFYTSSDWESPVVGADTIQIKAGSYLRYYCDYDNTKGTQNFIQGQSAATNEMCMFIGLYYPAMDQAAEQCNGGDQWGTGSVGCVDTLNCLQACPAQGDLGPLGIGFNECTQKCFVDSCADVSAPLNDLLNCIQSSCPACGQGMTDAGSSSSSAADGGDAGANDCTSCVLTQCGSKYGTCTQTSCTASQ